ncbi:MAG: sigma-70 family RNA polymerase sigma factor [Chloroflexota bacterium]
MDQAERERELSKPTSDEMVANSKAENTNNPSVEESRKETFNKVEKEEDVTSAVVTTSPFANVFLSNNMEAAQSRQAEALVTPVVNEANREEEAIVSRVLAGNTEAFAELIDRYKVAVYNLCARMLHDPSEAEDASQEVFLRTYNQLATYQPGRRFSTWILSIASHYCIDLLRRRRPIVDIDSIAFWKQSDEPEPEETALSGETRDEVRELLKKLPDKYRGVTVLRYWQDLSYEEIAEATGLSVGTVKTRLFRARELLAKELDKHYRNGSGAGNRSDDEQLYARGKRNLLKGRNLENKSNAKRMRGNQNVLP